VVYGIRKFASLENGIPSAVLCSVARQKLMYQLLELPLWETLKSATSVPEDTDLQEIGFSGCKNGSLDTLDSNFR
jgi:hypothetical protein